MNYDHILQTAVSIAHEAGAVVRDRFPRTRLAHIGFKGAVNPVTETDTTVEALIVDRLRTIFPDHRFLGEESGGDEWRAPGPPILCLQSLDQVEQHYDSLPCTLKVLDLIGIKAL